ncbi:MAG TPA: transcriptional regulator [Candidatus Limnocylindrales bacterium]
MTTADENSGGRAAGIASLDRLIHEPARLLIMTILATVEAADFVYLARETSLTKGNLGAHLVRLEGAGYIEIEKTYRGKVPRTVCRLSDAGSVAYRAYRQALRRTADQLPDVSATSRRSG